ncbi:SDR family oxidoreductase [Mucilaginibacter gotjawali]|uniref:UDP-N-acetylglucosamine 4-epimerase n=2 Tax=Mucilaginibacter gotjawali TaxID=1550579 RepID=A0A839S8X9_9SPHI|nr:SDR family oxidoreductase [Mucilaginibacter gotjawali]MBB3054088.1 UDP-N-acetylglucosamine 4-epimerase [Mucilaginibacter gotjawali]BAU54357.1 UDP-glucose 4-epimerase [Mucilaginibacter gotjawali]
MYETRYHSEDLSQYSFLVTGGAGFIGSNLVEYLLKYGAAKVRILDNFSTGSHANIEEFKSNPSFELLEGDIRDLETCKKAVKGIDFVSQQAALGSVPRSINDPITTNEVNISGFLNMLVAARDAEVKRFVYAASSSTYGDHPGLPKVEDKIGSPLSPYAVTKYVNELYASVFSKNYNFHTIGLRYFNVFGPRQNPNGPYAAVIPLFIETALKGESPFINGDGETSRDFTFVENVVQANIKAMLLGRIDKHEVMNIAFGERTTLNQLWDRIASITGNDIKPKYREERKGDVKHSLADISKALLLIGYKPQVCVLEGLNSAIKWYNDKINISG